MRLTAEQENALAVNQANAAIAKVFEAINTIDYAIPYIQDEEKANHLRTISRELGRVLFCRQENS